ncbi:MAG: hypothetical protein CMH28_04030 [Micavibrio sp.]|nr:hypothetical protein [Micavibrio sp.]|tara:strand:+ start:1440 stop:1808 length:369 start_codon:yes stop_codon:yes gene_type:complete
MNKPKILYIEDFEASILIMNYICKRIGYECVTASTGVEAEKIIATEGPFDLLLVDINLPDIQGDQLVPKLRPHTDSPIIGFTVTPDEVSPERAQAFDGLENKAFSPEQVEKMLKSYIENHSA